MELNTKRQTALYASVGERIIQYDMDIGGGALVEGETSGTDHYLIA